MSIHRVSGRILFECLECKNRWMPRRSEWGRKAGISCPACGSRMWMESKESRKKHKLATPAEQPGGVSEAAQRDAQRMKGKL